MDAEATAYLRQSATLDALAQGVKADMALVNQAILARTGSEVALIPEVAQHLISSGGKRIRPMLTLAMASLCGSSGEGHVLLAAAVEFMHTATLLHDDVVDESDLRRGRPTARMLWGNETSVLVGDFLLGQAFKMMVDAGSMDALRVLSSAAAVIAEGEVMQLAYAGRYTTPEETYFSIISAKTAALFAAACEVGPLIAQQFHYASAARAYGQALGMAFQLIDDALDYDGEAGRLGKNVGDDFRDGKMTLPVILAMARGDAEEGAFWRQAMASPQARDDAALVEAIRLIHLHNGVEETRARAEDYAQAALDALALFPQGEMKAALEEAAVFVTQRAA